MKNSRKQKDDEPDAFRRAIERWTLRFLLIVVMLVLFFEISAWAVQRITGCAHEMMPKAEAANAPIAPPEPRLPAPSPSATQTPTAIEPPRASPSSAPTNRPAKIRRVSSTKQRSGQRQASKGATPRPVNKNAATSTTRRGVKVAAEGDILRKD